MFQQYIAGWKYVNEIMNIGWRYMNAMLKTKWSSLYIFNRFDWLLGISLEEI